MEYIFPIFAVSLLISAVITGWTLTLLGLPGNWLMVCCAALFALFGPQGGQLEIGWLAVMSIFSLAAIGEIAEVVTSVWTSRRAGGSRRAAVFALLGSIAGAIAGATFGLPIPILGPPIAALLGGALGALAGAYAAEHSLGEEPEQSFRVGHAAFWGRVMGTGVKTIAGTIIAAMLLVGLII